MLSNDIFLEESETIVVRRYEMEYRHKSLKKFSFWTWPNFDAKNQLTEINLKFYPSVRLLVVTSMKEVKPVVTERKHLDDRDYSLLKQYLGDFGLSNSLARLNISCFSIKLSFTRWMLSVETFLVELSSIFKADFEFWYRLDSNETFDIFRVNRLWCSRTSWLKFAPNCSPSG